MQPMVPFAVGFCAAVCGLLGLAFAAVGFYWLSVLRRYRTLGICVSGKIDRLEISISSDIDSGPTERPVVKYEVNGKADEYVRPFFSHRQYQQRQEVPFYYLPESPEKGAIVCRAEYVPAIAFATIGTILMALSIAGLTWLVFLR